MSQGVGLASCLPKTAWPPTLLLTADSPDVERDLELSVNRGRGYSPAEERGKLPLGEIPVDAIYSPVRKVNYIVSRARIGQQTNYDRLALEIWTDGKSDRSHVVL